MSWTRHHERLIHAWEQLHHANARKGWVVADLSGWLHRNFGACRAIDLTPVQARTARRRINAWRAGLEGLAEHRPTRRELRNERRSRAQFAALKATMKTAAAAELDRVVDGLRAEAAAAPTATATATPVIPWIAHLKAAAERAASSPFYIDIRIAAAGVEVRAREVVGAHVLEKAHRTTWSELEAMIFPGVHLVRAVEQIERDLGRLADG